MLVGPEDAQDTFHGLVILSGHWIIHFAEEREHLGVAIGRAFAGGDGRAHIIHPDTHVFFLHIIIAGKTHALEWHVHHFAGDILLEKSASHNPMGFGGSFGFARGAVRSGHPKPCDDPNRRRAVREFCAERREWRQPSSSSSFRPSWAHPWMERLCLEPWPC